MVQKFWSDMTHDEKLDVLRNDIERLFAAINSTNSNVSQLDKGMTELFTRLTILQKKGRQVAQTKQSPPRANLPRAARRRSAKGNVSSCSILSRNCSQARSEEIVSPMILPSR